MTTDLLNAPSGSTEWELRQAPLNHLLYFLLKKSAGALTQWLEQKIMSVTSFPSQPVHVCDHATHCPDLSRLQWQTGILYFIPLKRQHFLGRRKYQNTFQKAEESCTLGKSRPVPSGCAILSFSCYRQSLTQVL